MTNLKFLSNSARDVMAGMIKRLKQVCATGSCSLDDDDDDDNDTGNDDKSGHNKNRQSSE